MAKIPKQGAIVGICTLDNLATSRADIRSRTATERSRCHRQETKRQVLGRSTTALMN